MAEICEADVSMDQVGIKGSVPQCTTNEMIKSGLVDFTWTPPSVGSPVTQRIAVITRYRYCVFPEGLILGKHVYSTTLLPGEEQTLEVFQSQKTETEQKSTQSVEEDFAQEHQTSMSEEAEKKTDTNKSISGTVSGGGQFGLYNVQASVTASYAKNEQQFQKSSTTSTQKAQSRTNRKNDLSVGTKTDVTTSTRSTRTIRNPNLCQSVTWSFFQLNRRMRTRLIADRVSFDVFGAGTESTSFPPFFAQKLSGVVQQIKTPRPTPEELLQKVKDLKLTPDTVSHPFTNAVGAGIIATVAQAVTTPVSDPESVTAIRPEVAGNFASALKELDINELADKAIAIGGIIPNPSTDTTAFKNAIADSTSPTSVVSLIFGTNITLPIVFDENVVDVATTSMHSEATTSKCMGCDTHTAIEQVIEREQLALAREQARRNLLQGGAIYGAVKAQTGPVKGAIVQAKQQGGAILSQTVTDDDGNYAFGFGTAYGTSGIAIEVAVVSPLPLPFTTATPTPSTVFFAAQQIELNFVLT